MIGKVLRPLVLGILVLTATFGMASAAQHGGSGGGKGGGKMGTEMRAAKIEGRIAFLKTALGIKENQLAAWNAYADGLRAQKHKGHSSRGSHGGGKGDGKGKGKGAGKGHGDGKGHGGNKTAMEQMDSRIAMMQTHIADLEALKPLATALYAVLDDDQKKMANRILMKKGH